MEDLSLVSRQEPGIIFLENFDEIKETLARQLSFYRNVVYSEDSLKAAKKDKATLNKLRKAMEDKRKEIKKFYMQPYEAVEAQIKELVAMIDEPLALIGAFIAEEAEQAKAIKRTEIRAFYQSISAPLGDLAETVFSSSAFYEDKWENATTSVKAYQDAMRAKVAAVSRDIDSIKATGGRHTAALLDRYINTMSMDGISAYKSTLEAAELAIDTTAAVLGDEDDNVIGYKVLKLTGTQQQLTQILDQMELLGIEVDEIENGLPEPMEELHTPDFSSFVAFDIETSGSYGAAHNDSPAQITEIGAVKVVDGQIVERFSQLANPGRKIVPRIAKLTGITDDMVADKPSVATVIRMFKEFVGDSILVGHNIKNCDIPYISKAARKAGIVMDNRYFDTYRFAKSMRDANGWANVKLEYLSEIFGIEQPDAHRAWCDAEANVGVYFKLKEYC